MQSCNEGASCYEPKLSEDKIHLKVVSPDEPSVAVAVRRPCIVGSIGRPTWDPEIGSKIGISYIPFRINFNRSNKSSCQKSGVTGLHHD